MHVQPYLFFDGRCDEALEFYRRTLGAEIGMLMRYRDNPEMPQDSAIPGDKVMHSSFRVGDTVVMASDGHAGGEPKFEGFTLSLTVVMPWDSAWSCARKNAWRHSASSAVGIASRTW